MHFQGGNSLKDWEDIMNDLRYLFRYEDRLINEEWMTASEFLEEFFNIVRRASDLLDKK